MKNNIFKLLTLFIPLLMVASVGCKKQEASPQVQAKSELTAKIDGVEYKVGESGLSGTLFSDAGDAIKAVEINAALDGNGRKMTFFLNNLTSGKIILDPKTGTSMLPNPTSDILQKFAATKGFMAGTGTGVQNYTRYEFSGSSYYAYSGYIEVNYDAVAGKISVSWSVTFKDATGKEFTSSGSFTIYIGRLTTTSKSAVKDPTPVSAKPVVESIAPTSGLAGTDVSIVGTNFSANASDNIVKFNGTEAVVKSATATKLVVTAPKSGTTGTISLKVKNSEVATGPTFTYIQPATFTGMSPASAKVGDQITLTGTNFSTTASENNVKFVSSTAGILVGGVVKSATATSLIVEVPNGAATGSVSVTVLGNTATLGQGFTGLFTLATPNTADVGKRGLAYDIKAIASAVDAAGNIYTYDDNQQLTKRSNSGTIIKEYTKNDFSTGIPALNSYKVTAMAADLNGKIYFLMYCPTWPNGSVKVFMTSLDTDGKIKKEFETSFPITSFMKMAINSKSEFFIASSYYNTDDLVRMKNDGTYEAYLKGGTAGPFSGRGIYDVGVGTGDELVVLTYIKGKYNNDVPTSQAIFKVDAAKQVTQITANTNPGYKDGDLAQSQFKDIRAIAVDGLDVYVGDNGNFRVRKIATRTGQVTTVAGNGKQYEASNGNMPVFDGPMLNVNIYSIYSLVFDNTNSVLYGGSNQKFVLN